MNNAALVTGASSGIGLELARIHAAQGGDLILVARREETLGQLKRQWEDEFGVSVRCIPADLTAPGAPQQVFDLIHAEGVAVEVLINNAGFGGRGEFHQRDLATDKMMIQLNVTALVELTHLALQGMVQRKRGKILNVASTAGFLPGPLQSVYFATKAFVLSFSQAIAEELRDKNVTVTALCPGPVATEFLEIAGLQDLRTFKDAPSAQSVAKVGYDAMMRERLVAINDWRISLLLNWFAPFLPRRVLLKLSRRTMEQE